MKILTCLLLLVLCSSAFATKIVDMPLPDQTREASEIAVAKAVRMVGRTADGRIVTNGPFRTGPGMGNTIWVSLRVVRVLKGQALRVGSVYDVPLWNMWHMDGTLGGPLSNFNVVVFLKQTDAGLVPAFPPEPYRPPDVEPEVRELMRVQDAHH